MDKEKCILHSCLYFTANALSRVITRMADEAFKPTGLSPSHAFLLMLVIDQPGIQQKELGAHLQLMPSTVTRFIDTLVQKGYLTRQSEGKASRIHATDKGQSMAKPIADAWESLHKQYGKVLGMEKGDELARLIDEASERLETRK